MAIETILLAVATHPVHALFLGMLVAQAVRALAAKPVARKASIPALHAAA